MIIIRVDASHIIGLGHLMRCLALADYLKQSYTVLFVVREPGEHITSLIENRDCSYRCIPKSIKLEEEIETLNEWVRIDNPHALIFDGYHLNDSYQRTIKHDSVYVHLGLLNEGFSSADIVVNPNPWATADFYKGKLKDTARLLVGADYVLIGKHIQKVNKCEPKESISNVLITFGGGSDGTAEYDVYDCLKELPYQFDLVVGQMAEHRESSNLTVHTKVYKLGCLMQKADLVICASGSTCWELSYLGLPFISYIVADNQTVNAEFLKKKKASIIMGDIKDFNGLRLKSKVLELDKNHQKRRAMSVNGRNLLIDGMGAKRVANTILEYIK